MKILVVHNAYQTTSPSGEDVVAREEAALLRDHGHEVVEYWRGNDELLGVGGPRLAIRAGVGSLWSARSFLETRSVLRRERPELCHFHNTFPLISPSAYLACRLQGVPVVQTLHNFRLVCANGLLFRDGAPCELCPREGRLWGVVHGCYRGSRILSTAPVLGQVLHGLAGTHGRLVDRFIALTEFAREKMIGFGLPAERIAVKPNFAPRIAADPSAARRGFLFAGRVDEAKGVRVFAQAARHARGIEFAIVGDGPLEAEIARDRPPNLDLRGRLRPVDAQRAISGAAALVVPSLCYEGFPRVVAEAMSAGTPVIASGHGGLADIVSHEQSGLLFAPGDAAALAAACVRLAGDDDFAGRLGAGASEAYQRQWTPEANAERLVSIYRDVLEQRARGAA